ncbi:nucleoside-diphosphate-sugar epimerase family protein [Penicillium malachiteum]|nr:nucleoside-diphosphate-sugar epimerase family protein [Penicillium malachiteum]
MTKVILVTGATGKQGGSVVDKLLERDADVEILAVTRDASSNGAQRLKSKSSKIQLVEGNLDEPEAIFASAKQVTSQPIWGVFSVQEQVPVLTASVQDAEERQGKILVDAALKNDVKFFVYSSVDRGGDSSYENPTDVPHFISKHNIEHHLVEKTRGTDMRWTILRPVAFLDAFSPDFTGKFFTTTWKTIVREKKFQTICLSDIGFFAAEAFLNPDEWKNKFLSLAGDSLTFEEMSKIFYAKTGRRVPTTFGFICTFALWWLPDFGKMFHWFYNSGFGADIPALRKMHPGLKNFETWLETESAFVSK